MPLRQPDAVKMHPIVARPVEAEVLAKLIATNNGAGAGVRQEQDG